jgi:hypothetical protein
MWATKNLSVDRMRPADRRLITPGLDAFDLDESTNSHTISALRVYSEENT